MSTDWYCRIGQETHGPMTAQELQRWAESGKLRAGDLVRKTDLGKWVAAATVKGLTFPAPVGSACPSCGARLAAGAVLCVNCGYDKRTGQQHAAPAASPLPQRSGRTGLIAGSAGAAVLAAAVAVYFLFLRPVPVVPEPPPVAVPDAAAGPGPVAAVANAQSLPAFPRPPAVVHFPPELKLKRMITRGERDVLPTLQRAELDHLPASQIRKFYTRQNTWDPEVASRVGQAWRDALEAATGEQADVDSILLYLNQFDQLWDTDRFQQAASDRCLARLRGLPVLAVPQWQLALGAFRVSEIGKVETAGYLLYLDRLFAGTAFQPAASERLLAHARSIPSVVVREWARGLPGKEVQAAVAILGTGALFDAHDQFNERAAADALAAWQTTNAVAGDKAAPAAAAAPPTAGAQAAPAVVLTLPRSVIQPPYCEQRGIALLPDREGKIISERLGLAKGSERAFTTAQEAWKPVLARLAGAEADTLPRLYFLLTLDPLWAGGNFQADVSQRYFDRAKVLTDDVLETWSAGVNAVLGNERFMTRMRTVGVLVQLDALFPEGRLTRERSEQLLTRFRSIGPGPRKAWFDRVGGDLCFSALELVGYDDLFAGAQFREDAFRQALAALKRP